MSRKIKTLLRSDYAKVYFFELLAKLFSFSVSILIIRSLSKNDYSEYTLFNSVGSFISGILGSGIGLAYTRYAVELRQTKEGADVPLYKRLRRCMYVVVAFGIVTMSGAVICFDSVKITYFLGAVYGFMMALSRLNIVFFQAREKYSKAGIISNISVMVMMVLLTFVFIFPTNMRLWFILGVCLFVYLCTLFGGSVYVNRVASRDTVVENNDVLRNMLKESFWIIMYMFVLSAFNQLDVFLLEKVKGAHDVASYGVAHKYYSVLISALPAIQVVLRVKNSSVEMVGSTTKRRDAVVTWMRKVTPLCIAIVLLGVPAAHVFMPLLNGAQYYDAVYIFDILLIGVGLSYLTAPNVSVMLSAGKQKTLFYLAIGAFLINVIGNVLLIPSMGAKAAAATTIVAHFFLNGGSTLILLRE